MLTVNEIKKIISKTNKNSKEGEWVFDTSHLLLVLNICKKYRKLNTSRISFDDIFQEAIVGLLQALEKYDKSRNVKFEYFAKIYIINKIREYLRENSHFLSFPSKTLWKLYKIKKIKLEEKNISNKDIMKRIQTNQKEYDILCNIENIELVDIEEESLPCIIKDRANDASNFFIDFVENLNNKEKEILYLKNINQMSWREIGKELNISHETARKKYNNIITVLKSNLKN